jgi:hypothetical protein
VKHGDIALRSAGAAMAAIGAYLVATTIGA